MADWIEALRGLGSEPRALVTVLASEGAAAEAPGARWLLATDEVITQPPGSWRIEDRNTGKGRQRLLVEHVDPAAMGWLAESHAQDFLVTTLEPGRVGRAIVDKDTVTPLSARGAWPTRIVEVLREPKRPLYLFGAGHVGRAVAKRAAGLPLHLAWFDTRGELAEIDGLTILSVEDLAECIAEAPEDAAFAILTHDRALDYAIAAAALSRPHSVFVGMIGGKAKRERVIEQLAREGIDAAGLTCPIGLPGIHGRTPEMIALAVVAQIVTLP